MYYVEVTDLGSLEGVRPGDRIVYAYDGVLLVLSQQGEWLVVDEVPPDLGVGVVSSFGKSDPDGRVMDPVDPVFPVLNRISGPSAGFVRALAWVDALSPGADLTGGCSIAATGSVPRSGTIGEVAHTDLKLQAARDDGLDLVLVWDEYDGSVPDGLTVVPVAEALDVLDDVSCLGLLPASCH